MHRRRISRRSCPPNIRRLSALTDFFHRPANATTSSLQKRNDRAHVSNRKAYSRASSASAAGCRAERDASDRARVPPATRALRIRRLDDNTPFAQHSGSPRRTTRKPSTGMFRRRASPRRLPISPSLIPAQHSGTPASDHRKPGARRSATRSVDRSRAAMPACDPLPSNSPLRIRRRRAAPRRSNVVADVRRATKPSSRRDQNIRAPPPSHPPIHAFDRAFVTSTPRDTHRPRSSDRASNQRVGALSPRRNQLANRRRAAASARPHATSAVPPRRRSGNRREAVGEIAGQGPPNDEKNDIVVRSAARGRLRRAPESPPPRCARSHHARGRGRKRRSEINRAPRPRACGGASTKSSLLLRESF